MTFPGAERRATRWILLLLFIATAAQSRASVTFGPPSVYPITGIGNSQAQRLFTGDFTGEGKLDLLVVTSGFGVSNEAYALVYPGKGDGTFDLPISTPILSGRVPIVGDFNGDGKLDLAIVGPWNAGATLTVTVYLGDGTGSFSSPVVSTTGVGSSYAAAAGDLNGDGVSDLVVGGNDALGGAISVLLGTKEGRFNPPISYTTVEDPRSVAIGDLNGDGIQDLVVSSGFSNNIGIHIGQGDGTFRAAVSESAGDVLGSVLIDDYNGDGRNDIAVANSGLQGGVSIFLNHQNRYLDPPMFSSIGSYSWILAAADFDRDDVPDLLASLSQADFVLAGRGDGTFGDPVQVDEPAFLDGRAGAAVGDFNSDGAPDFALLTAQDVAVELNLTAPASSPALPPPGTPAGPPPSPVPQTTPRLNIPDLSVQVGSHVRIPVQVDWGATGVTGVQFDLVFGGQFHPSPPCGLVLGPVIDGFGSDGMVASPAPGTLTVHAVGTEPRNGPGTLVTLDLFIPSDTTSGTYPMTVSGARLIGTNGESLPVEAQAGSLTILPVSLGDVGPVGKISIANATQVLLWAVKLGTPTAAQFAAADVNKDGVIDIKDVTLILRAIVNGTAF